MTPAPGTSGYWMYMGLQPAAARALVKAGCRSLDDLAGRTREEITALPGFGPLSLARLEERLGSPLPSRTTELEEHGIPRRTAEVLIRAGIDGMARLGRMTREQFLSTGLAGLALRQCERALGGALPTPSVDFRKRGMWPPSAYRLAVAGVRTLEEVAGWPDCDLQAVGLREEDIRWIRRTCCQR